MRLTSLFLALALTVPATVRGCEGDCIVGITDAFLGNYTEPVERVLMTAANQISLSLPHNPPPASLLPLLHPLTAAYTSASYAGLEKAIFPSYFHGKCLDDSGAEPDGCPNPDCPIVCGTPGSLVHFYGKLAWLVFNQTRHILAELSAPGSDAYEAVEKKVLEAYKQEEKKTKRSVYYSRMGPYGTVRVGVERRDEEDVKKKLKKTMQSLPAWLEQVCGASGPGEGQTNGLPRCRWEEEMKPYILSFP